MQSQAQMRSLLPSSVLSRDVQLQSHTMYPPTVTSFTRTPCRQLGGLQPDRGHLQHEEYPSLYPTAPTLPHDFAQRQSWVFPPQRPVPALPSGPDLAQQQTSASVQIASQNSHPRASDSIRYPVIAHGPGDASTGVAASGTPSTAAAAPAAVLLPQQAMQELHSGLGTNSNQLYSGAPSDVLTRLSDQSLAKPVPVLLHQDAFESGELLPGAFSPLGTALMHMQAAQVSLNQTTSASFPLLFNSPICLAMLSILCKTLQLLLIKNWIQTPQSQPKI